MRIYYKVTTAQMMSAFMYKHDFRITYELNKWIKPHKVGTSIMVFKTLERAKEWAGNNTFRFFKCKVKHPSSRGFFVSCGLSSLKEVLRLKLSHKKYSHLLSRPPKDTVFCSEIKLLKRVY